MIRFLFLLPSKYGKELFVGLLNISDIKICKEKIMINLPWTH